MNLKVENNLHFLNSHLATSQKTEIFNIGSFQLDDGVSISSKEMEILPLDYKNDIKNIFFSVLNKKEIQKEAEKINAVSISIKVVDGKLVYKLNGSKEFKSVLDEKIQKTFIRLAKDIRRYLNDIGSLKEKQIRMSKTDKDIIETSPKDVEKIPKKVFKKMEKSNAEWSFWALFVGTIVSTLEKIIDWLSTIKYYVIKAFSIIGIDLSKIIPKGVDEIFSYLINVFGLLNAIEIEKDSKKIGDTEGIKDGKNKILSNVLSILKSIIDFISKTLIEVGSIIAKTVLTILATALDCIVSIYCLFKCTYSYLIQVAFRYRFSKYTENKKLTKIQRMTSALKFLKSKVTVASEEAYDIINKVREQNPNLSDYKIKKIAHEEISKKVLTKVKRFERRVGDGIAGPLQENVDKILKNPTEPNNIRKGELILNEVKKSNDLQIQENQLYAVTTVLDLMVVIISAYFGELVLTTVAGVISGAIVSGIKARTFYKKHIKREKELKKSILDEKLDYLADPLI